MEKACILATLAINFILSSMNLSCIWEVNRGGGEDYKVIRCLTEFTACVVVKPILNYKCVICV